MKVLVAGHTYIKRPNQEKFYRMSSVSGIEFMLVVPEYWEEQHFPQTLNFSSEHERVVFKPLPVRFGYDIRFYLFHFFEYVKVIKGYRPDIIQVEAEPYCWVYLETIAAKWFAGVQAKLVFFSWNNLPNDRGLMKRVFVGLAQVFALKHTDGAACGSPEVKQLLLGAGAEGVYDVIPQLGADSAIYKRVDVTDLKTRLGLACCFTIGYAGRLLREKGILTLIRALPALTRHDWKLLIVGNGDMLEELMREASAAGVKDRIVHLPGVDQYEVVKYLNCMDALVLPSLTTPRWKEQFGKVLIDAMCCGVPVIGSDSGAIPWVIGDAGLVFREGDEDSLAACLDRIIGDEAFRQELIKKADRRVSEEFSNEVLAEKYVHFYEKVMNSEQ